MAQDYELDEDMLKNLDRIRSELNGRNWEEIFKLDRHGSKFQEANDITTRATMHTKRILTTFHDDTFLYNSLFKIFSVFVQTLGDEDVAEQEGNAPKMDSRTESSGAEQHDHQDEEAAEAHK